MTANRTVLGIVGSVSDPSKTATAVDAALAAAADREGITTETLRLADHDLVTADGRTLDAYEGDTAAALEAIVEADAYVVGTPIYRGSLSGALKNLFDMVPRGMWQADVAPFEDAAVALVATGATNHHYLAIDQELRPIFGFFGAHTVGGSVYANDDHFESTDDDGYAIADDGVRDRLADLGRATVELDDAIANGGALSGLGPQF
ncbi:FMN reductase [Halopenitus malekzadehii]|uniref:FMN reductase n=1 Tax=Halopenitus malekzadehii TaxID=1267564 RepID=A0A1H6IES7_9EURY|nr:NAD(P)H-dependent oxidoreductase [Halopenitus malekzadehii]SEH47259.1 FMN reductase [Halopenitus malekzadehii]